MFKSKDERDQALAEKVSVAPAPDYSGPVYETWLEPFGDKESSAHVIKRLNQLGAQGWEPFTTLEDTKLSGMGFDMKANTRVGDTFWILLKRRVQ